MKKIISLFVVAVLLAIGANAAFGKVNTYSDNFSDVKSTSWYAENVKTAYELGFMNGKAEGLFDPDGNVTVIEGITMASRLHALYRGTEVSAVKKVVEEYRIEFDQGYGKMLSFNRAEGTMEDGVLVVKAGAPNSSGVYDPQIRFDTSKLELLANDYDKVTIRMKVQWLPHVDPNGKMFKTMQFYFSTNKSPSYGTEKLFKIELPNVMPAENEWFDIVIECGKNANWTDYITNIRLDPCDGNGIFSFDYIAFSKSDEEANAKWYDMYVDYALANGIYNKSTYTSADFSRNITRAEVCNLFASSIPEDYFNPINDVKGIPDIVRDEKNAEVYLMLYKAGILLGADEIGNFKPAADIKRSEIAAIINRVALPENRVKGSISADWSIYGTEYDIEFDDEAELERAVPGDCEVAELKNGALMLKPLDRGDKKSPRFDPKVLVQNVNINADEYEKLKVRMKVELIGEKENTNFDFYFKTAEDESLSEAKSLHQAFTSYSYLDPAGWYVMEVDLKVKKEWTGEIVEFRFDPCNTNGIYTIDYIRFVKGDILHGASHEKLVAEGYTATRLLQDEAFERGFYVSKVDQTAGYHDHGIWQTYTETDEKPLWGIGPWWIGTGNNMTPVDLWDDRDTTADKYTLTDKYGINTIKYNPEEKSISMRQDTTKIFNGKPHIREEYKWWPHLLLEQSMDICEFDKVRNSAAAADRMFFEIDIKLNDYKRSNVAEGENEPSFPLFFYLMTDKAPGQRIYFGIGMFSGENASKSIVSTWSPDSAGKQYMYGIPHAVTFGGIENSFNPERGVVVADGQWKKIRLDITSHIDRAIEWANRDNIFGVPVTKEDMYISGANIGFETHGNYDYEFEFKNFNMVAYNKN